MLMSGYVSAHEFTPTYPKLTQSFVEGLYSTKMVLLNKRKDVEYYEIKVFDEDWERVPFAVASGNLINIKYLERKRIEVYIKEKDINRARYICSKSKLIVEGGSKTSLSSRICSKIK